MQFYGRDTFPLETIVTFLREGLEAGDHILIVATGEHRGAILNGLRPFGGGRAVEEGRMLVLDASQSLARIMAGEMPDVDRFRRLLDELVVQLNGGGTGRICAYGEMVNILWRRGKARAALRLEELWNEARKLHPLSILCSYGMDSAAAGIGPEHLADLHAAHDLVLPVGGTLARMAPLDELGTLHPSHALEAEVARRIELEKALDAAMQSIVRLEHQLAEATARERTIRARAEASDAFEELFIGILGNDLRRPIDDIASIASRLGEGEFPAGLPGEAARRILSGTAHIGRMLDQLMDLTRVRSRAGFALGNIREHDLVPVIARVVEDAARTAPDFCVVLRAPPSCMARVDANRFEQVIANLVGNALVHGDPAQPVNVTLAEFEGRVSISVQNCGRPIPRQIQPILFSPFARGPRPPRGPVGLGLGLYLSELIVAALGGRIEVESNLGGTLFEVILPRLPSRV